jgi:Flp pilus assembly protein TadG
MSARRTGNVRGDEAGGAITEFAMVLPVTLMLIIGLLQAGIQFWRWQALEAAAIDAARCAGINAALCQQVTLLPASTQSYAATAAQSRGLYGVTAANVTVLTGSAAQTACGGTTAIVVSVSLSYTFGTIFLVTLPSTLSASACYPLTVD